MSEQFHPITLIFENIAKHLDEDDDQSDIGDAIARLARWIDANKKQLSADDRRELLTIGGIMFREGLGGPSI